MLRNIFNLTSLTVIHTSIASAISVHKGAENGLVAGVSSATLGTLSCVFGAFVGDYIARETGHERHAQTASNIVGYAGYATGAVIGFCLGHSA